MKNLTSLLALVFLLAACGGQPTQPGDSPPAPPEETPAAVNAEKVIYKDAVVYAASTDFVFTNEKGEQVMVRVSNLPEERTTKIPDSMTDPNAEEGPPGANPALVGKAFLLVKNEKGEVVEIKQAQ